MADHSEIFTTWDPVRGGGRNIAWTRVPPDEVGRATAASTTRVEGMTVAVFGSGREWSARIDDEPGSIILDATNETSARHEAVAWARARTRDWRDA